MPCSAIDSQRIQRPRLIFINKQTDLLDGPKGWISASAVGNAAGICAPEPISHLNLHPIYGAWFSMRCLLIFDDIEWVDPQPESQAPVALPPDVAGAVQAEIDAATAAYAGACLVIDSTDSCRCCDRATQLERAAACICVKAHVPL